MNLQQVLASLEQADAAGDAQAAQALADLARSMMGSAPPLAAPTAAPAPVVKQAPMSMGDTLLSAAQGVVGATKATIEGVTGAGSGVGESLEGAQKWLAEKMTPERRAEQQRRAMLEKEAARTGKPLEEIAAGLGGIKEAPVQTVAQGMGSSVPTVLLGMGAAAAGAAVGAPLAIAAAVGIGTKYLIGAIQGAGEVKGTIYDAVKGELEANKVPPEEAKRQATAAQDYLGKNWEVIAQGAGLGAIAGGTGAESALLKKFSKPVAQRIAAKEAGQAAEKGAVRGFVEAAGKESAGEGLQGGQQQYAENVAVDREGYKRDAMSGVYGAAARDAAMGALTGAAVRPFTGSGAKTTPDETPPPAAEPGAQLPPDAAPGTQGTLFTPEEMGKPVPAPKAPEETVAAAVPEGQQDLGLDYQREYTDMVQERERLKQQPQTPEVKARVAELADQMALYTQSDIESIRAEKEAADAKAEEEAATREKFPALAEAPDLLTQPDEVKARTQGELFPGEDLGTAPTSEAPIAEPTLRSKKEQAPVQAPLGLRRNPEGQPTTFGQPEPTITSADIMLTAVPVPKGVEGWLLKNVVGSTRTQLDALIAKDPTLVDGSTPRAKILRSLTAKDVPAFKEAPRVEPTTTETPAVEQRDEPRAGEPSVGVPSEPAAPVVPESGAGVPAAAAEPVTSDGRGLVPAGRPAVPGTETQGGEPPAVTADQLHTQVRGLIDQQQALLSKSGQVPREGTPKAAQWAELGTQIVDLKAKLDAVGRASRANTAAPTAEKTLQEKLQAIIDDPTASKRSKQTAFTALDSLTDPDLNETAEERQQNETYAAKELQTAEQQRRYAAPRGTGQALADLEQEIEAMPGKLGNAVRKMRRTGKLKLEEGDGTQGGLYDGKRATLYARGVQKGQSLAMLLHEVGAHMGMRNLLGQKQYDAVIDRIVAMTDAPKGSLEKRLAATAYDRIPEQDRARGAEVSRDELVAYFVEGVAYAEADGQLPKRGPLRVVWDQIKTAITTNINRALGTSFGVNDLTPQQIADIATAAIFRESKTGVATEATPEQMRASVPNSTLLQQSEQLIPKTTSAAQSLRNAAATLAGKNSKVSLATRIRTAVVDPLATVEQRITKEYDQGITDALGNTASTVVARQAQDITKMMQAFYEEGALVVNQKTRMLEVKKGKHAPDDIFPIINKMAADLGLSFEEAFAYTSTVLEGMRLQDLVNANQAGDTDALIHWRTPSKGIDYAKINAAVAEYNSDPRYKQLADIMDAPRIGLIDELEKAGRLTPDMAKDWREVTNYVPFDRMQDLDQMFSSNKKVSTKGLARLGRLPQLVGSEWRPVGNVFENYFKTMGWMSSQLAKQNANSYMMGSMVNAGYASYIPSPKLTRTGSYVMVYSKGEERYYDVASKWDQMAFQDDSGPTPQWVRFLGQVSGVLRTAITANPVFAAAQVAQDVQGAILFSGVKNPLAFVTAAVGNFGTLAWHETANTYRALRGEATVTHKIEQDMRRLGLSGEVDYAVTNPAMEELFRQGVRKRTKLGSTTLGAIIHGLEQITHSSDLAVRKALYDDEMRRSNDVLKASTKAREMINFRRRGSNQWVQHWVTMVPFFNAALQSTDIVYRSVTSKADPSGLGKKAARVQFMKTVAMYGSAALMYSIMRSGDDDYEEMDRRVRDGNWVFPGNVRIPIRGDMGVVKVAIENGVDYLRRQGTPEELDAMEAIKTVYQYAYEQYVGRNVRLPAALQPLFENFANFSFMTGRAQVGTYQQSKPKQLQETAGTTETAKAIADFVYTQFNGMQISPVHIDNALRGYLGTTAATITMLTDAAIYPDKIDRPLHKMVAVGAFAWDETQLTNPKNEFYTLQEKILPPVRAFNEMKLTDPVAAEKYAVEHQTELMLAATINHTLDQLSKIRAYEKYLKGPVAAQEMADGEREAELLNTRKYANELVGYVRQVRRELRI